MKLGKAISLLLEGHKIRRKTWKPEHYWKIHSPEGGKYINVKEAGTGKIINDWEIWRPPKKQISKEERFNALNKKLCKILSRMENLIEECPRCHKQRLIVSVFGTICQACFYEPKSKRGEANEN